MKITAFDKTNLKAVRTILQEAFNKIQTEHGINLSVGTIRFDATSFRTKLEARVSGNGATAQVSKYDSLESVCMAHGYMKPILTKDDIGKEFKLNQYTKDVYIILGGQVRAYKFGVLAKHKKNGKVFKFKVHDVAQALGRKFSLSALDQNEQDIRESLAEGRAEAMAS
jgi:uncharacterized protein YlxP (DUF503 family)